MPADGRLVLPVTSHDLVVHELRLDPPPRDEHFGGGARWFAYEPGTRVIVHSRFRRYSAGGASPASDVFPGALRVREGAAR